MLLRRSHRLFAVLVMVWATHTDAGVVIWLVPSSLGPYDIANPSSLTFNVDVFAQLDANGPATFRARFFQFDLADSSPAIRIAPVLTHPGTDVGDIYFWDFSSLSQCSGDPAACGDLWNIDSDFSENLVKMTFLGLNPALRDFPLTQSVARRVGVMQITLPADLGAYPVVLDVLNADDPDPARGAAISYGRGTTQDPRVDLRAFNGQITGGRIYFVPEPATLMLLCLGGVAALKSKRRWHRLSHLLERAAGFSPRGRAACDNLSKSVGRYT